MRKFIYKILIFTTTLLVVNVLLFFRYDLCVKFNVNNFKLSPNITKLIVGDSHVQLALNEKYIPNSVNLSIASESYLYTYKKIKLITLSNPRIDTIFIGAGYHNFSSYYDNELYSQYAFNNYFYIFDTDEQLTLLPKYQFDTNFLSGAFKQLFKKDYYLWKGGFDIIKTDLPLNSSSIKKRIQDQFLNTDYSLSNIKYFDSICSFCELNKITLIAINTPLHKMYYERVPLNYIKIYNNIMQKNKIRVIDFKAFNIKDEDFLPDGDHVNEKGAAKTSVLLYEIINNNL